MHKRLGELLTEKAILDHDKISRALRLQENSTDRLGSLLVSLGFLSEHDLAAALANQLNLRLVTLADYPDMPVLDDRIAADFLKQAKICPVSVDNEMIVLAMSDPLDDFVCAAVQLATGRKVIRAVGIPSEVIQAIDRQYASDADSAPEIFEGISDDTGVEDEQHLKDLAREAPVVRLVSSIISKALKLNASDIHVEPFDGKLVVRYRVDGILTNIETPPAQFSSAIISRIKVLSNLNIAERRLPQDGRIRLRIEGHELDLRISTVPTMHGESVVLRILDKGSLPLDFASLGFGPTLLSAFQRVLDIPHGIVLVTGPTGGGKTTTLYAALNALNSDSKKLLTVEDPVEYQLEGINQIQVKPQIGLTFASALRSILRQDPDVIMVGEMRDEETARIAVQSALTGHKVFSTLHTNDAASSVIRLLDMGIDDYLVTSTVNAVVAQRLVRTLCAVCKKPTSPSSTLIEKLQATGLMDEIDFNLHEPTGCAECGQSGYKGRTGILELLVMSDPIREVILSRVDASSINRAALDEGMRTMYQDGVVKALHGLTTLEEVVRVTQEV